LSVVPNWMIFATTGSLWACRKTWKPTTRAASAMAAPVMNEESDRLLTIIPSVPGFYMETEEVSRVADR
jgi:hypothetical protein